MKKEVPQGLIIGVVAVVVLLALVFGWKMLAGGNPPRENIPAGALAPDALPEGAEASGRVKPATSRTQRMSH